MLYIGASRIAYVSRGRFYVAHPVGKYYYIFWSQEKSFVARAPDFWL